MTPNSSVNTYLTAADFLLRRDVRSVMGYCTDNGDDPLSKSPIAVQVAALTNPGTMPGAILMSKLKSASGMLESAVLRSGRYASGDLQSMLSQGGNDAEYCKEILASIAMYALIARRPGPSPPDTVINSYTEAIKALNDLSEGVRIFAFAETEAAGRPVTNQFNQLDYLNNNLVTARWSPMFGQRQMSKRNCSTQ